jgi:hypothetical protein
MDLGGNYIEIWRHRSPSWCLRLYAKSNPIKTRGECLCLGKNTIFRLNYPKEDNTCKRDDGECEDRQVKAHRVLSIPRLLLRRGFSPVVAKRI